MDQPTTQYSPTTNQSKDLMESDIRDRFIKRVVNGKSFADVGGLWGVINEKVSVAHAAGATSLSMIDFTPPEGELWTHFTDRMKELSIGKYGKISGDICELSDAHFEVVHCSGVLYHHPTPMTILAALREVTREHLILTSAITQETIRNEEGIYRVAPSGAIFIPALDSRERAILGRYWKDAGAEIDGIHSKIEFSVDEFGPWWWIPTRYTLVAMCRAAGFDVVGEGHSWNNNAYTVLLRAQARKT
jgi:hypothetical protein